MMKDLPNEEQTTYLKIIANAVAHVANEPVILAQFGAIQDKKIPKISLLANEDFDKEMDRVAEHLGSPPEFVVVPDGYEAPPFDHYPLSILHESINTYHRASKSVARAQMFMVGAHILGENPEALNFTESPEALKAFQGLAYETFWEHAETAYIRLASYWDRVGQVLDFAYFNIRQYDKLGFDAVMNRIHSNAVQMNPALSTSSHWKKMRAFQTSEKDDGLKWLLSRRNTVVHSLHLHPLREDAVVLKTQYNHFEESHRNRLMPRSPEDEVRQLMLQLERAASLFHSFLVVAQLSPSRQVKSFYHESDLMGYTKRP